MTNKDKFILWRYKEQLLEIQGTSPLEIEIQRSKYLGLINENDKSSKIIKKQKSKI